MLSNELKQIVLSKKETFDDIYGQEEVKRQLKSVLLTQRSVLIVGPPGVGKTTIAKNLTKFLGEIEYEDRFEKKNIKKKGTQRFVRIQGSPDLTVEDILGDIDPIKALKFGPLSLEAFSPGKIFKADKGILFFDELNRCPEKLQNALLQVLQERKATIGSYDVDFDVDLFFIATMNPEDSSTEKLSDVLMDRFDVIYMTYPETVEIEMKIVEIKGKKIEEVKFPTPLLKALVTFVRDLRDNDKLEKVPGVRATIGLYERAQANALLKSKKEATFDDVRDAIVSVLSHRIKLKPSVQYLKDPVEFIKDEIKKFMDTTKIGVEKKGETEQDGGYP